MRNNQSKYDLEQQQVKAKDVRRATLTAAVADESVGLLEEEFHNCGCSSKGIKTGLICARTFALLREGVLLCYK